MSTSALSSDAVALQLVAPDVSGAIGDASGASQRVMGRELANTTEEQRKEATRVLS